MRSALRARSMANVARLEARRAQHDALEQVGLPQRELDADQPARRVRQQVDRRERCARARAAAPLTQPGVHHCIDGQRETGGEECACMRRHVENAKAKGALVLCCAVLCWVGLGCVCGVAPATGSPKDTWSRTWG